MDSNLEAAAHASAGLQQSVQLRVESQYVGQATSEVMNIHDMHSYAIFFCFSPSWTYAMTTTSFFLAMCLEWENVGYAFITNMVKHSIQTEVAQFEGFCVGFRLAVTCGGVPVVCTTSHVLFGCLVLELLLASLQCSFAQVSALIWLVCVV